MNLMRKYRVSGIDESYFPLTYKGKKGKAILASVVYDDYEIVSVDFDQITVDGNDGTETFLALDKGDIAILDGVIFAGFNYIMPKSNFVIFYGKKPNISEIKNALIKHFSEENDKIENILYVLSNLKSYSTKKGTVYLFTDLQPEMAIEIINKYQVFTKYPEPIRTAHIIANAIMRHILSRT